MEVIWTQQAEQDYYNQIDFLMERWSEVIAEKFIDRVFDIINLITQNPYLYTQTDYLNVRKAVLNKHISLFYSLEDQNIVLLRFWPNQQNPDELDL